MKRSDSGIFVKRGIASENDAHEKARTRSVRLAKAKVAGSNPVFRSKLPGLGWTRDAVRAACARGELDHSRDHLNNFLISCSAIAAFSRSKKPE